MTGATGNYYCGLHEHNEMGFVLHALRPGDLFIDVGANVGSYTVLAAGAVGAQVIAIEPLPATFARLQANIRHNDLSDRVEAQCCGLSFEPGELIFTSGLDTKNRLALPGEDIATVTVPVRTLDAICEGRTPRVIKIDVEGHEASVLQGAIETLARKDLDAVLMETNGAGEKFGASDAALVATMRQHGFTPCAYDAIRRRLSPAVLGDLNTIFVRDTAAVQARCEAAPRYALINSAI
jgi:FkbM family methyltransferase